jgi:hypothetical protein
MSDVTAAKGDAADDLIREIAVKHGIAVSRDDPILVLQTLNSRLLQDSARAQQEQLDRYKEALEGATVQWSNDARDKAERVLNAALAAGREAAGRLMLEAGEAAAASVRSQIDAAVARISASAGHARRSAVLNLVASSVSLAAAASLLWTVLR